MYINNNNNNNNINNIMSFLIKGGYNSFQKTILNMTLKKSNLWQQGLITTNHYKNPICKLNSYDENHLEIVKYHDMHALMINNMVVYEKKHLFTYDVELLLKKKHDLLERTITDAKLEKNDNIYHYVTYYWVNYDTIKHINGQRYLN
jgi:hypothetical protein